MKHLPLTFGQEIVGSIMQSRTGCRLSVGSAIIGGIAEQELYLIRDLTSLYSRRTPNAARRGPCACVTRTCTVQVRAIRAAAPNPRRAADALPGVVPQGAF